MKVLLIGSGGREHAIALKLKENACLTSLFIAPGNAGTADVGKNVPISEDQIDKLFAFAKKEQIDLTIVGPELPLVKGIVDLFRSAGLPIIGPDKHAAQLEGSKQWAKKKMKDYGIPTADSEAFITFESAMAYLQEPKEYPLVIKADGLAAGKGVVISQCFEEAKLALEDCFIHSKFNDAGKTVLIESFLKGEELSIFAFCDGESIVPMIPAQDHKRIFDGDKGPNTGGMGAYSPVPIADECLQKKVYENVFLPLQRGFKKDGIVYKGIIFAGLMVYEGEPSVIEFNARFGDPETQVVLALLQSDLLEIFQAIHKQRLGELSMKWSRGAAACVVMVAGGYPGTYENGKNITIQPFPESTQLIVAGAKRNEKGELLSSGGRVLGLLGKSETLKEAVNKAYQAVHCVNFDGGFYRKDIGKKGLS